MTDNIKAHLSERDPEMEKILAQTTPEPIASTGNVFHDLMSCVIEQQIHYRSTKKTFAKLLEKAGIEELNLDNWEEFEEKALVDVKLSRQKLETISGVVDYFWAGDTEWDELSDRDILHELRSIKGVGRWTADMILLYTLGRPNVFPADDYHLKRIMARIYNIDPTTKITDAMWEISRLWTPFRAYGTRTLLATKDLPTPASA